MADHVSSGGGASPGHHLDVLRRISARMTAAASVAEVLDSIVRALVEHADVSTARVWLFTTESDCEVCAARGPTGEYRGGDAWTLHLSASAAGVVRSPVADVAGPWHQLPPGDASFPGLVAARRTPYFAPDVLSDPAARDERMRRYYAEHGFRSFVGYPLLFRGELLGVLGGLSTRTLAREEFEHLAVFASQAALAIQCARMLAALERSRARLAAENEYLREEITSERGFEEIVGRSPALAATLRQVERVAATDATVLLTGETGTGKELVARAVHGLSARRERALVKVSCAASSPGLVESELFGHEKGAFTGALQRRIGRFELANGGTLYLDEVGELTPDVQAKLLRVLQGQEFERVGGSVAIRTDARIVAATNRDLESEVAAGRFRADLFYRLNVFPVRIPPLRERPADVPLLVQHFLAQLQRKLARPLKAVSAEGMARLQRYRWPGNIRELQNVVERAAVLATSPVVEIPEALLPADCGEAAAAVKAGAGAISTLADAEREHILRALRETGGVIHGPKGAARLLAINANTLRSRMQKLGIARPPAR